ncbi:LysR family transcriptional regulator [Neorhizobium sp. NPDC001467]|uniref:LysR family transcriptional regulator n=1 Tax=Neorhizobium sp. NPDC001467 TaxID=3390595 RepID=UPI003CFDEB9D
MNGPSWDHYRTFLAIVRTGSLSAAARDLGLTQPTAGRHIESLEYSLGHSLFTRSRHGLIPTEVAFRLVPYAKVLSDTTGAILRLASADLKAPAGTVRIAASDVMGTEVLPPILKRLQDSYPGIAVELSISDSVEDLLHLEADIAVRMTPPTQEALVIKSVGSVVIGLYAHREYIRQHGMPETEASLQEHRFIGYDQQTEFIRSAIKTIGRQMPDFPPVDTLNWIYRCDSNVAQFAAIRAGVGIGFAQVGLAKRDANLVRVLPTRFQFSMQTWIAMHEDLKATPRYRVVFDELVGGLDAYCRSQATTI